VPPGLGQSAVVRATGVRLLDTAAPGSSLRSSMLVFKLIYLSGFNTLVTQDGSKIVCSPAGTLSEFSNRTGKPVRNVPPAPDFTDWPPQVLWTNASGTTVIVLGRNGAQPVLGVYTGSRFTPLPSIPVSESYELTW
jgi:hypothetical protein